VFTLVLTPLGALLGLLVVLTMMSGNPMELAGPGPLVGYLAIAAILGWVIRKYSAREAVNNPLAFGAYLAWTVVSSLFLTTLALCTLDSRDWGTRTKEQEVRDVNARDASSQEGVG
jgi:membrane-associated protease RseP (regulator of RpoE activity)